ncbi:putative uncharacterized protein C8orf44 [Plecturocebus cupreus]
MGEMPDIGEGEEGNKLHATVTYATILKAFYTNPKFSISTNCEVIRRVGWVQWVMPVIPALSEPKAGGSLKGRSSRAAWATWRNLISSEKQKN